MSELAGQIAFVTGAAVGMGAATAVRFAQAGATVVVTDVDEAGARRTAARIEDECGRALARRVHVAEEQEVASAVAATVERFGRLDCAVNNAALRPDHRSVVNADLDEFDRLIAVNLRGVLACMKHQAAQMLDRGHGSIVNIGSTSSFRPQPGSPAYAAAKHGGIGLTRTASSELAPKGIRVNAVCPGATRTPMLEAAMQRRGVTEADHAQLLSQFGRFGEPEEVAEASLWLATARASFVTGHALAVDGGYTAW